MVGEAEGGAEDGETEGGAEGPNGEADTADG